MYSLWTLLSRIFAAPLELHDALLGPHGGPSSPSSVCREDHPAPIHLSPCSTHSATPPLRLLRLISLLRLDACLCTVSIFFFALQDVWATLIHPDDHKSFFDSLSIELFRAPGHKSEFIKICKVNSVPYVLCTVPYVCMYFMFLRESSVVGPRFSLFSLLCS